MFTFFKKIFRAFIWVEKRFIDFLYEYRKSFLIFFIIIQLGMFAWWYPDIVSSAAMWFIAFIFAINGIGLEEFQRKILRILDSWQTVAQKDKKRRYFFYSALFSIGLHFYYFKPDPKFNPLNNVK